MQTDTVKHILSKCVDHKSHEEQIELVRLAQSGDEYAREELIKSNIKLVSSIAKDMYSKNKGVPYEDLLQVGMIGLNETIDKFKIEKGFKFATYAYFWIRQEMTKELTNHSRIVRVPAYVSNIVPNVIKAIDELQKDGIKPDAEKVAKLIEKDPETVSRAMAIQNDPVSLDVNFSVDGHGDGLTNIIIQKTYEEPEEKLIENSIEEERKKAIEIALETLPKNFSDVIKLRYGLTGEEPKTLVEVSKVYGLTKERIRQIEKNALQLLGDPNGRSKRRKNLKNYL